MVLNQYSVLLIKRLFNKFKRSFEFYFQAVYLCIVISKKEEKNPC